MKLTHYIDGQWVSADTPFDSINPSDTSEVVASYPAGGAAEVGAAVDAARRAFPGWSNASPELRSDLLDKVGATLMARAAELGELLAREEGKTRAEATGEVMRAARIFKYFAGEALRRHGQTLESTRPGLDVETWREAVGVYGLITPWNFPIAIPAWKSAPALAFGNTVVLKPANPTPAIAHALATIIHEDGSAETLADSIVVGDPFGPIEAAEFLWQKPMDRPEMHAMIASRSVFITAEPTHQRQILAAVDELLDTHPDLTGRDVFAMPYRTFVFRTRLLN